MSLPRQLRDATDGSIRQLRRGAALLWPSVLDADPNARDDRTEHESVAVVAGTKFAANYWLHMWDFQQPTRRGCGNTEIFGNW